MKKSKVGRASKPGRPQTKARATVARPARRSAARAPAKTAAKRTTKPQTKARARPQTKPARRSTGKRLTEPPAQGEEQESAIRRPRNGKEIVEAMARETRQPQTVVRTVLQSLGKQVRRHLRPRGSGQVTIPELNVSLRRYAKPATKPRQGWNPATREPMTYPAKPARITVRAKVLKKFRDQIGAATS